MESANLCTALVALGQMAVLAPTAEFVSNLKPVVQNVLVKQILMQDQVKLSPDRQYCGECLILLCFGYYLILHQCKSLYKAEHEVLNPLQTSQCRKVIKIILMCKMDAELLTTLYFTVT